MGNGCPELVATQETVTIATSVGRSPQSVPDRRAASFARAASGGTLIEVYDLDRKRAETLAPLPEGGEFHAWTPDGLLLSTAMGNGCPELVATQETVTIATSVGRSPQSVPDRRAASFARAASGGTLIEVYDLDRKRAETLAPLPEGGEFHAWTPDGLLLSTAGSRVLAWRDGSWQEVADLADLDLSLSRLAVSPDGTRLALVAEPTE